MATQQSGRSGHGKHADGGASMRALERGSGSAAAREAQGRKELDAGKRRTRYQRAPTGQKGSRSREP